MTARAKGEDATMLETGTKAFDFALEGTGNRTFSLADFQGKWLVLFFYPKDGTSG